MTLKPTRVLIVADSPFLRRQLVRLLVFVDRVNVVGNAGKVEQALAFNSTTEPHVVLLDLLLPTMSRVAAVRALRDRFWGSEIVALVSFLEETMAEEALHAGAIGCVPRDKFDINMLEKAILFAYNGMRFRVQPVETPPARSQTCPAAAIGQPLTSREQELLGLLVRGLSTARIAECLVVTPVTVKFHLRNIRSKLGTKSRAQTVAYAISNQLVPDE